MNTTLTACTAALALTTESSHKEIGEALKTLREISSERGSVQAETVRRAMAHVARVVVAKRELNVVYR